MKIKELLQKVDDETSDYELTVEDVVQALEYSGFGPMLLFIALLTLLPTGAIPGVPTVTAILIVLISAQMLFGRRHPWIPQALAKRGIEKEKFQKARKKTQAIVSKIDLLIRPRWQWVFQSWTIRLVALCSLLIAATMPPLELLPFAVFVPAVAIGCFGLGLTARDGVVVVLGYVITLATLVIAGTMINGAAS